MSSLVAEATSKSTSAESRIGFFTEGDKNWPVWDRFITLDGKKAFHIGNICETCAFLFERLDGANDKVSPVELSKRFKDGITQLDEDLLRTVATALPAGEYRAMLIQCVPRRVLPAEAGDYFREEQMMLWGGNGFRGLPHYTKTEYYRTEPVTMTNSRGLFEFIVPMFPKNFLYPDAVSAYKASLSGGATPTALAISVLDVKQPAECAEDAKINAHWCLTHYLLDGHHKTFAASELGLPISILSFLAVKEGVSTREQIEEVIQVLAGQ